MSISSKMALMKDIETKLSNILVATDLVTTMNIVSDALSGYEIELIRNDDCDNKDDLLQAYLTSLQIGGRSEKTVERYRYIINRMLCHVGVATRRITAYHLRGYMVAEKARGISDTTLEGNRQVYSAYFNWLHREGLIVVNPAANISAVKCRKKIKAIYSEIDIEKLRMRCENMANDD